MTALASTSAMASRANKQMIVHPAFRHTVTVTTSNVHLCDLPPACLHKIAGELQNAKDLLRFKAACVLTRQVVARACFPRMH